MVQGALDKKRNRAGFGTSFIIAIIATFLFTSFFILTLYILIQKNTITNWVKNYLSTLLTLKPNNAMLRLFSKNIDSLISKEYILSYTKNTFIGFLAGAIAAIILVGIITFAYYQYVKEQHESIKTNVKNNVNKKHFALFFFTLSIAIVTLATTCLILLSKFIPNNISSFVSGYIDKISPNARGNGFIRVFKGMLQQTFQADQTYDLLAKVKHDVNIGTYVILAVFSAVAIISLSYMVYKYIKNKNAAVENDQEQTHENNADVKDGPDDDAKETDTPNRRSSPETTQEGVETTHIANKQQSPT